MLMEIASIIMLVAFFVIGSGLLIVVCVAQAIKRPLTTFACIFLAAACVYTFGH